MVTSTRSRLRHQRTWSPAPRAAPCQHRSGQPPHQRHLGWPPPINVAWSRLHRQRAQSIAPPGADSVINVCVNRTGSTKGLRNSPLNDNQCRSGQPLSSTFVNHVVIRQKADPPVNKCHSRLGQPPLSTSLGADSIVNVLSQQHRPGQPPSSTYVSTTLVRQQDSG